MVTWNVDEKVEMYLGSMHIGWGEDPTRQKQDFLVTKLTILGHCLVDPRVPNTDSMQTGQPRRVQLCTGSSDLWVE